MGRARQETAAPPQPSQQAQAEAPPTDAQIAAAVAAILSGAVAVASVEAAVGVLLGAVVAPFALPDLPAQTLQTAGARIATTDVPSTPASTIEDPLGRMYIHNLLRRAHYAIKATRRMGRRVAEGESVASAIRSEAPLYRSHREAEAGRVSSAEAASAHLRRYGTQATWVHGNPKEPRPNYLRADGGQFDVTSPPLEVGGVLPGVLPGCTCSIGAPRPSPPARRLR